MGRTHRPCPERGVHGRGQGPTGQRAGGGARDHPRDRQRAAPLPGDERSAARRQGKDKIGACARTLSFSGEAGSRRGLPGKRAAREKPIAAGAGAGIASRAPSIPLRSRGAPPGPRLRRPPPENGQRWEDVRGAADPPRERGTDCPAQHPPPPTPAAPGLRARRYRMTPGTGVRRRGLTAAPPAAAPGSAIAPIAIAIAPIAIPVAPPPIPARSPPFPHLPGVRRSPPLRRGALVGGRPRPAPPAADWPRRPPLPPHANDEGSRAAPIGCSAGRAPRPGPAPRGAAPSP